jgi:hypothetical protein
MNAHTLFQAGLEAGRTWRSNPSTRSFSDLPYYGQRTLDAQRFNRAFAYALQGDPAIDADTAYSTLLQQRLNRPEFAGDRLV